MDQTLVQVEEPNDVNLDSSIILGFLVLIALIGLVFVINLNSYMWNPVIWGSLRSVEANKVQRLGPSRFVYLNETRPFSGESLRYSDLGKTKLSVKRLFVHGMLHTKTSFHPDTGQKIIEVFYENEKVVSVNFFSKDGVFLSRESIESAILTKVKSLGYMGYYRSQVM